MVLPIALAQPNVMIVSVSVEQPDAPLAPGNQTQLNVTVRNDGSMDGVARLNTTTRGPGWATHLGDRRVPLDAGEEETIPLSVEAPETRDGMARLVTVTVRAALSDTSGSLTARDEATVEVALEDPPPFLEEGSWLILGGIGVGALLLVGALAWRVGPPKGAP